MVDLPSSRHHAQSKTMVKRTKYKKKPFKPIDNEQFREIRMMNRLSIADVANLLQVTQRTVANWESGSSRIPYSAFKLLRYLANGALLPDAWKGWTIKGDTLWSPVGRPFRQHELNYISNYFTMARYWQADYELRSARKQEAQIIAFKPSLRVVLGGRYAK
jgi:DNA-binding transcriptional regulator YiaG